MSEMASELMQVEVPMHTEHDSAIPVRIVKEGPEKVAAADLASFRNITIAGTEDSFPLLSQDPKRRRAVISISGAANQVVQFGRQKQASAKGTGFILGVGQQITTEAASEMWVMPQATNGAVTISVMEERFL